MKKIYLYGSGRRCQILLDLIKNTDYQICGIVDGDAAKWGQKVNGITIESPEVLEKYAFIYVCVTFYSSLEYEPVWDKMKSDYGISYDRQLSFHDVVLDIYQKRMNETGALICGERKTFLMHPGFWGLVV